MFASQHCAWSWVKPLIPALTCFWIFIRIFICKVNASVLAYKISTESRECMSFILTGFWWYHRPRLRTRSSGDTVQKEGWKVLCLRGNFDHSILRSYFLKEMCDFHEQGDKSVNLNVFCEMLSSYSIFPRFPQVDITMFSENSVYNSLLLVVQ